ncbi:alpha/beta hydrolase [Colwellia sp. 1_MG-2023]|uniref:alpha/beta hydrolase n=1 Tax=Colwellia sp. 1_MG-2023 TaxID=3062649 RepID=UPI0026E4795F|nr:alpha/beta hydrolase [Colwellia sp. 1_MG-2023]MDO6445506.1 alpha/beta hydrolase [Colwellia sp. 1_MG-2023]
MSKIKNNHLLYQDFDLKSLEQEYSPSSCIDDINVYINQYLTLSQQNLLYAQQQHKVLENLQYGYSKDEVLDLFLPFDSGNVQKKIHVYFHGGYWQELSKNESCFAANNFQQQGFHFAVINYSLAPQATLTEIVEQCRQAIVWLYQHANEYGYDNNEIYLSGSSAGGHLAMMLALTDWSQYLTVKSNIIKGICAVSGIYDLTPIAQTYINKPLQLTSQEIIENSPLLIDLESNHTANIPLPDCKVILAYGDNETNEFKRQTNAMKQRLTKQNIHSSFTEIEGKNHFDVILDLSIPDSWLSQSVLQQMA